MMPMKWPALVAAVVGIGAIPASGEGPRSLPQAAGYIYGGVVLSVDWFGSYLAVGGLTGGGNELRVLRLEGGALTEIATADFDDLVYSLAWHPSGEYLAVGGDSSFHAEVRTFAFDGASLVEFSLSGLLGHNMDPRPLDVIRRVASHHLVQDRRRTYERPQPDPTRGRMVSNARTRECMRPG